MQSKNSISLLLMITSLALLLTLQFFWLQKVYNEGLATIAKESNQLLRSSVRALQDSIIQRNIVPLDSSGVRGENMNMRFRFRTTGDTLNTNMTFRDSIRSININREAERVEIQYHGYTGGDSMRQVIASPIRSAVESDQSMRGFMFRTGIDSIRRKEVRKKFGIALHESGLNLDFEVKKIQRGSAFIPEQKNTVVTDPVPVSPFEVWIAYYPKPTKKILANMLPEFLFCIFLSLITSGSFYTMHKSLRSQNKLMQLKNELISNITHELKTPVATVSVALEAIKNFNVMDKPELTKEYLEIAQHELNRLSLMTDKILKSALFEEKGLSFEKEIFDFSQLCDEILKALKLVLDKQDAKVNFVKEGNDFNISASKLHLSNVMYNLLDNALKYSESGVAINIRLKSESNRLIINVSDTGFGIPPEYHKKIFEKFFRVPTGDVHNIKGYGLGLSYVASVIKGHKGTISLESEVGKGSSFIISLPKS
jgi:two-component system, OmpR family, phosphate regulon sensor histidine kinase PhoR